MCKHWKDGTHVKVAHGGAYRHFMMGYTPIERSHDPGTFVWSREWAMQGMYDAHVWLCPTMLA